MDGIIYAIAGDTDIEKLLMSVHSVRSHCNLPVAVYACLTEEGYNTLVRHGIAYYKLHERPKQDSKTVSRLLKTSVHKISQFSRTIYMDNDMVVVKDPSWIFDEIPDSGIIFGRDAGKTVEKFSKYATPGKKLDVEIEKAFGVYVDPKWHIWNGGLFAFDDRALDFMDQWHERQKKIPMPGWAKRDQGTLIATVWDCSLSDQKYLPPEANFLHGLHRGLKFTDGKWVNTNSGLEVTNIHMCLSWGKDSSETWRIVKSHMSGLPFDPKAYYFNTFGNKQVVVVPSSNKWPKSLKLIIESLSSLDSSVSESEYGFCCRSAAELLLGKEPNDAAIIFVHGKIIMVDYNDYVNATNSSMKKLKKGVLPDLVLKCQYRAGHKSYAAYKCPVLPFVYPTVDTHSGDDYLRQYRKAFLGKIGSNDFQYSFFGRLANHKPRAAILGRISGIPESDVALIGMNHGQHHKAGDGRLGRDEYFSKMASSMFCIDGPGSGNITHRLVEAWAMSQPVMCPRLKNSFYMPIEPGVHYIELASDYSDLHEKFEYYREHYDEALKIGFNGMEYYDEYCTKNGIANLFMHILTEQGII